jgi:hypothetical protein
MGLNFKRHAAGVAACAAAVFLATGAYAQSGHEHMDHAGGGMDHTKHMKHDPGAAPSVVPALKILMPGDGDIVGSRLAVVFETPADMSKSTMGHHAMGMHLHVEAGATALMPSQEQLVRLGGNRYLFLFDLPAQPGSEVLRVSWADGNHKTIESSIQKVTVTVAPEGPASQ